MTLEPKEALEALFNLVKRCPMTPAEAIGAQACLDVLQAAITPKPPVKSE